MKTKSGSGRICKYKSGQIRLQPDLESLEVMNLESSTALMLTAAGWILSPLAAFDHIVLCLSCSLATSSYELLWY